MPDGKTVLVIDDEADLRGLLELTLSGRGYRVVSAASGKEGLIKAQGERPDVILLDIMMEEMDGWEVLKLLRVDETLRDIPVLMVTARSELKDRVRGLQEGAVDYITKPFDREMLVARIETAIAGERGGGVP
jgi:DNA-binding response OmpR family regulator